MATDERFDELISTWLQETAPVQIPTRVLDEAAQRTRTSRQQVGWRTRLGWFLVPRAVFAIGTTAAVMVAAVLVLSPRLGQPEVGKLPTTPDAWSGVPIDSRWTTAQVDGLVAGPRGLLAILGELGSGDMQLSVSTDGRTWTLVPNDQFPSPGVLWPHSGARRLPAVGTTGGFLFVAEGNDVWASEDGYTWQRRADRAQDADLRAGAILAVAAGGPGLVAVGSDNKAWTSEDGSDWTLAEVPAPPTESFAAEGYAVPTIEMLGVTVAGDTLVAWGSATATGAGGATPVEPVLWTSADGRSWTNVPDISGIGWLRDVAAGPNGYVAIGGTSPSDTGRIWFSKDGRAWQPADNFEEGAGPIDLSIAATGAGYVAVGGDELCAVEPCPNAVAAIWASPDGRSWSRLLSDDLFTVADPRNSPNHSGAWATSVVARDDHFVVAGAYDASPVVWISGTPAETEAPVITAVPSSDPGAFLGIWVSTSDNDGGTQTMTVEPSTGLTVDIVVTDTIATVCSGTSSTMTGSGSVESNQLVIPAPDYRCDDGTEPQPMGGPGLNEELRNLKYTHDPLTDTLSVGIGDVWVRENAEAPNPAPQPSEQVAPPSTAEDVASLLDGFLEARIVGEGAEPYITADAPDDQVPLLYATTSGARYERAEFERVDGIEWPYAWTAFKVRLFAGETIVEQLVFVSDEDGRLGLGYVPDGFGTDIVPTTENGLPVAAPYDAFEGEVTLYVAHPWVSRYGTGSIKLIPEGARPTTDGGERNAWDRLVLMADPARTGTDCPTGSRPTDAEALAESFRSDPDFEATTPVAVGAGGAEGLMMDVRSVVGANPRCESLSGDEQLSPQEGVALATGVPLRLYLFDAPEGSSMRVLALAINVPERRFERAAVEWAGPIVQFHAP